VLKPISPLAWMPIALYTIKIPRSRNIRHLHLLDLADADQHGPQRCFRAARMARRPQDARVNRCEKHSRSPPAAQTISPACISMGIAWLIVAAEMLVGTASAISSGQVEQSQSRQRDLRLSSSAWSG
jgi:hypothetical protein